MTDFPIGLFCNEGLTPHRNRSISIDEPCWPPRHLEKHSSKSSESCQSLRKIFFPLILILWEFRVPRSPGDAKYPHSLAVAVESEAFFVENGPVER